MRFPGSMRRKSWVSAGANDTANHEAAFGGKQSVFGRICRVCAGTRGGALVEVAVTLPPLFLLMTGIFSFSIAIHQKLQLAEAISSGGRTLAVDRGDTDPCNTTANAIYGAAPGLSPSSIGLTFVLNGVSTSGASCPGSNGGANTNMVQGKNAQVTATYTCHIRVYGFSYPGCTLTSRITESVQ
jgi:Flp pilus assembly protein TadG